MPRKTPVKELQKEEVVATSPLRRSTRLSNSSPVPTKVLTRRNSATEATTSTPKATRSRRSSLSQETESTEDALDKKKPTSAIRTRRSSLTQNTEEPPKEEPKTRATRGSSVSKEPVEVKKTTRRRRSLSEEPEVEVESNKKISRSRSGSLSKKGAETSQKAASVEKVAADDSNLEIFEETQKETDTPAPKSRRRNTEVIKIDMDLSVINEASLTEEEMSPPKKAKIQEEAVAEVKIDSKDTENVIKETEKLSETEQKLQNIKTNSGQKNNDSSMSDTSFDLQLSSSALENSKNEVDGKDASNKENVCPQVSSIEEHECEPMEVDSEFDRISPIKSKPKVPYVALESKLNEIESKIKDDEKLREEIDQFLSEEVTPLKNQETNKNLKIEIAVVVPTPVTNTDFVSESTKNKDKVAESPVKNVSLEADGNKVEEKFERSLESEKKLTPIKGKESVKEQEKKQQEIVNGSATEETTSKNVESPVKNVNLETESNKDDEKFERSLEGEKRLIPSEGKRSLKEQEIVKEPATEQNTSKNNLSVQENAKASEESILEKMASPKSEPHSRKNPPEVSKTCSPKIVITEVIETTKESDSVQELKAKGNGEEAFSVDDNEADGSESDTCATRGTSIAEENSTPLTNVSCQNSCNDDDVLDVDLCEENNKTDICDNDVTLDVTENKNEEVEVIEEETDKIKDTTVQEVDESSDTDLEVEKINENVDAPEKQTTEEINLCDSDSDDEDNASNPIKSSHKRTSLYSISDDEIITKKDKNKEEKSGSIFDRSIDSRYFRNETKAEKRSTESESEVIELSENESETREENNDSVIVNERNDEIEDNKYTETEEKETTLDTSKLSRSLRKRSLDTSITLQETIKAEVDKEGISGRIHRVVDLFCAGIKNKSDVSINVSLEYTGQVSDSEDETDKIDISLTAVDLREALTEPTKGSKRRKICHSETDYTSPIKSLSEANESLKLSPKVSSSAQKPTTRKSVVDSEIEDSATQASPKTYPKDQGKVKSAQKRRSKADSESSQLSPSKSSSQQDNEDSDDEIEESSEDESNNEDSKYYKNILAMSFEENDANDTSFIPDTESTLSDSEFEDEDEEQSSLKKSISLGSDDVFVQSVEQKKTTPVRKNKSEPENKSPLNEDVHAEVSSSTKKTKRRRSEIENIVKEDDDRVIEEQEKIKSSKKDKKRKSQAESELIEESTKEIVTSPVKKVTPSKSGKKTEVEDNTSDSDLSGSDEFEDSVYYQKLLAQSYEENEEDVTWKPSSDEESDDTDHEEFEMESESSWKAEEETKETSCSSSDKVFEDSSEQKPKKRKLFRLSTYTMPVSSSNASEELDEDKEEKPKSAKKNKQEESKSNSTVEQQEKPKAKKKKKKQSKEKFFSQSKNTENMVPETSEVPQIIPKGKKRKHTKPLSSTSDTDNSTVNNKKEESISGKKFQEHSVSKRDLPSVIKPSSGNVKNAKSTRIKPSKKTIAGWEVTKIF